MMPSQSRWKNRRSIQRMWFSEDAKQNRQLLGRGIFGSVYAGKLKFKDGSVHRVTIQEYQTPLSDSEVRWRTDALAALRRTGMKLPKMGYAKLFNSKTGKLEWVLVSQFFGSRTHGSKLAPGGNLSLLSTVQGRAQAMRAFAQVAAAGFVPSPDFVYRFKDEAKGAIPFDVDHVRGKKDFSARSPLIRERSSVLFRFVIHLAHSVPEYDGLSSICLETVSQKPALFRALKKSLDARRPAIVEKFGTH